MKTSNSVKNLNSQLAQQNARVENFLDSFLNGVDAVAAAANESQWSNVIQQGQDLADDCYENGLSELGNATEGVICAAYNPDDLVEVRRRVMKMIGASGRMPVAKPQQGDDE